MKLNIIIPTYNRVNSLARLLRSLANAEMPPDFEVSITVVDNNSSDATKQIVEESSPQFSQIKLNYLFEKKQGKTCALNSGIKFTDGELLAPLDDDEEIAPDWFVEIEKMFRERWNELDFASGKVLPKLESELPSWVEPLKLGVLCWRDFGDEEWIHTADSPMITGSHGIFKREVFDDIGLYNEKLGPTGKSFNGCEDDILNIQLIECGKRGIYNPKLIVYHHVPKYRLEKNYYRQWLLGGGISAYLMDLYHKPYDGAKLFGVPRWLYKTGLSGIFNKFKHLLTGDETASLAAEHDPIILAGYFYARNLQDGFLDKPLRFIAAKLFGSRER